MRNRPAKSQGDRTTVPPIEPLTVGIHGASGRMGIRLIQLIQQDPGADARRGPGTPRTTRGSGRTPARWPASGRWACRCRRLEPDRPVRVVIDFSAPAAALAMAKACAGRKIPAGGRHHRASSPSSARSWRRSRRVDPADDRLELQQGGEPADAPARRSPRGHSGMGRTSRSSSGTTTSRRTPPAAPPCGWRRSSARRSAPVPTATPTAARGSSASGPAARSACTPCVPATTRASTPSSSA